MARPRKPDMTEAEHQATEGLGVRLAAAKVRELRGANLASLTREERNRRWVGPDWVADQRKKRRKTQPSENPAPAQENPPSENANGAGNSGPRIDHDANTGGPP